MKTGAYLLLASFLLSTSFAYGQQCRLVKGKIVDNTHAPLGSAIVSAIVNNKEFYATSDNQGFFSIRICNAADSTEAWDIALSWSLIGFQKIDTLIAIARAGFDMGELKMQESNDELHEVIVTAKPIEKHGDTTIFNVNSFQNKLDDNLEDVLRKIPGFDIDANGAIKFNGKAIDNILIEGDEMTKNYKSISQNITPDMISKIQMIDKWNKNPILKELANSNNQVMNLTLKNPNHVSTFGKVKLGAGIANKINITGNAFLLNAKLKTMAIGNANNIGTNPYSEIDYSKDYAPNQEYEFDQTLIPAHVQENNLFGQSVFGTNQKNDLLNRSRMGVLNNNYRPSASTNIKLFSDFYADKINQTENTSVSNLLFPQFSYYQQALKNFRPQHFTNNFQYINTKANSRILLAGVYEKKRYQEDDAILSFNDFTSNLKSNYTRTGIGAYFTKRLDSSRAYEISAQYLHDDKSQDYTIESADFRNLDTLYKTKIQWQQAYNKIDYLKAEAKVYYKFRKNWTSQFSVSDIYFNSNFFSALSLQDSLKVIIIPKTFANDNTIAHNSVLANYKSGFKINKFTISGDIGVSFIQNKLADYNKDINTANNGVFFVPKLNLSYAINSKNTLFISTAFNAEYPPLDIQNSSPILTAYRSINYSIPLQQNFGRRMYNILYNFTDYNKGASLQMAIIHFETAKGQIQNIRFAPDFDYYTSRYENVAQVFNNISTKFDKYFFDVKTSVNIKNNFTWMTNPVEVNGKVLSTKMFTYKSSISIRPNIIENTNLALGTNYQYTKDLASSRSIYQLNPFMDILTTVGKKISIGTRFNYYRSNYHPTQKDYLFATANLWYTIIPKKLDIKLSVVNMFNSSQYYTGSKNGYLERNTTTQILSRFALLEFAFKF